MRQPRPQMIARAVEKNLRLVFEPAKSARMNDAGAVALKLGAIRMTLLRKLSAARITGLLGTGRERCALRRFHFFARFPTVLHRVTWFDVHLGGSNFSRSAR